MTDDLYSRATAVLAAKRSKTEARRRNTLDTVVLGTVPVLAVATCFASGWSLYDLGVRFHMPTWAAWSVFALIDIVWLQSAIVVIKNQRSPHRAIEAHSRMQGMFRVSVAANFIHGLILFGVTWTGLGAGAVFALFPIGFKVAFANAFPDFVKLARQAGYGGELDKAFQTEVLMRIISGVDQAKAELGATPVQPPVRVDRAPDRPQSAPVHAADQPVDQIDTAPEPAPVHAVQTTVQPADRPAHPDGQVAELLGRLRRGDQITKQDAADILGVPPSTAYRRLNAAKDQLRQYN
ncbi:hypothetical protein [Streptomyces tauricus]|uniref:hypothetical protein n=1 Tax=Streptomyces tauricus TaxID=68274 RepID=UPI00342A8162